MQTPKRQQKKESTALYIVYAAAAYFGLQYLLRPRRAAAATVIPKQTTATTLVATDPPSEADSFPAAPSPGGTVSTWTAEAFPLRKGMKGPSVKALQQKLGVSADGKFGSNTEAALLKRFGVSTVSQSLLRFITQMATTSSPQSNPTGKNTSTLLKTGSRGQDVYRLQKWLGFKDKSKAKKGEPVADSIFGAQTLSALQRKTGKSTISVEQLSALTKQGNGMGYASEMLITKRAATILDSNLLPYRTVPENTILGTSTMELADPQQQKAYTQFRTVDGLHRWVEKDAV